jgi:hypothetical protein
MDQEKLMWERWGLSRVKYVVQIDKRDVLHEMEEYLYTPLQKLAVGKILRTSRPDRSATRGQTVKKVTTTLIQKNWPLE